MFKECCKIHLPESLASYLQHSDLHVYSYAVCVAIGVLLACIFIQSRYKKVYDNPLNPLFFYVAFLFGFIGGKLFFYFEKPAFYLNHPNQIAQQFNGGYVCYGSILAVTAYSVYYARKYRLGVFQFLDIISLAATIPILFGRLGCFMNGCCYGIETHSWIGVQFPQLHQRVHPTQLYEAAWMLLMFITLLIVHLRTKIQGSVILLFMCMYALGRSIIECYRADERGFILNSSLSHAQAIALATGVGSLILYALLIKKHNLNIKK